MLRKQPKAIRNKRRKRLTKKEYIKVKPPSNKSEYSFKINYEGRYLPMVSPLSVRPKSWSCFCCEKTIIHSDGSGAPSGTCWHCQSSTCMNCFADDERCFGEYNTYICKKCLWKRIRWFSTEFKPGFEVPEYWRKIVLRTSWTRLKTL